jgi:Calcineurin-like phosphoesterase
MSERLSRPPTGRAAVTSILTAAVLAGLGMTRIAAAADPVVFSFATVGDSRQDPAAPDPTTLLPNKTGTLLPQDKQWLQNTKAFARILRTIQAQKPQVLFFNGDMIYGYGRPVLPTVTGGSTPVWTGAQPGAWTGQNTTATITPDFVAQYAQYAYWRGMVGNSFETGTYILPVPGNHETQCNQTKYPYSSATPNPNCAAGTRAYADNENAFRANTADLVNDLVTNARFQTVTGVTAANANGLTAGTAALAGANNGPITGSQVYLSYSFDIATSPGILHFVVINTDPSGADGIAPSDWLANDLAAAKARGAIKYFVFGHKPAFTYNYAAGGGGTIAAAGLDATAPITYRDSFWSVIAQYGATYFCGHEHTFNVSQNADPTGTYPGTPYQVIVGSGGSAFDDKLVGTCPACSEPTLTNPTDRYYAWALVQVHQSGVVTLTANGFNDAFGPTQLLYTVPSLQ